MKSNQIFCGLLPRTICSYLVEQCLTENCQQSFPYSLSRLRMSGFLQLFEISLNLWNILQIHPETGWHLVYILLLWRHSLYVHGSKTAFTRCRHILKTMKNVTVAKSELAFTRCRNNLKTVGTLSVKSWLQDFDAIERYLHPKCQSVFFQKRRKLFYFKIFKCLHDAVSKMCPLEFRFQNLPFSKSAGKKCAVFV